MSYFFKFFFIFGWVIYSCNQTQPTSSSKESVINDSFITVQISPGKVGDQFPLDSLVESVRYVQLELNESSSFKYLFLVKEVGDYILVQAFNPSNALIYHKDGTFVGQLGSKGRGPGEYNGIADVIFNQYTDRLEILTNVPSNILSFDYETLEFIEEFSIPESYYMQKFLAIDAQHYVFNNDKYEGASEDWQFHYLLFDKSSGNFVQKWLPHEKVELQKSSFLPRFSLFGVGDKVYGTYLNANKIYEIGKNKVRDSYLFDFESTPFDQKVIRFSSDQFKQSIESGSVCCINPFFITERYIFGQYRYQNTWGERIFFDRKSQKSIQFATENVINPFNGFDFKVPPIGYTDNELIFQYEPYLLQDHYEEVANELIPEAKDKLEKFLESMEPDGNTVLVYYRFKDL